MPIRVELQALTKDDLRRILTEPEASLIKQYVALLTTEQIAIDAAFVKENVGDLAKDTDLSKFIL